ncbi:hypothetical protein [Priestia megaterium]|uniref:hypothetical protein n=1 Tax=Priestia megaterium TaxID=1404 RepID=UPI00279527A1|nr:hypothetical protein [Priestia megaterium]
MKKQKFFLASGIISLVLFLFVFIISISSGHLNSSYYSLIILTNAVVSLSLYFSYPHVQTSDERSTDIKKRAALYTFIFSIVYLALIFIITVFFKVDIQVTNYFFIFIFLLTSTFFLTLSVVAKKS